MILDRIRVGDMRTNCYILGDENTRDALLVDPGADGDIILERCQELGLTITNIALTHFHFDHIIALDEIRKKTGAPAYIHALDAEPLRAPHPMFYTWCRGIPTGLVADHTVIEGDIIRFGQYKAAVLHTPGHSPGGMSLYIEKEATVLTGDALFYHSIGRTDLPWSSGADLKAGIRTRLFTLPPETLVYPGHGRPSTIGEEIANNPYI